MPTDRFLRLAAAPALALVTALLAGCTSGTSNIRISDLAAIPSARVSVSLTRPTAAPAFPQNGHAIEASYTGAKGNDKQELESSDDPIILNGVSFPPGSNLNHEYRWKYGELLYRWRRFFGGSQVAGMEVFGGVGHGILNVASTAPGLAASRKFNTTGLALGVGGIWKLRPETSVQLRLTAFGGEKEGITSASRFDVHLVHVLASNVALRGGLTHWSVSVNRFESDVRASFGGPAVALDINF